MPEALSLHPRAVKAPPSARQLLFAARRRLENSDTPRLDAELLLCRVLGVDRGALYRSSEQVLATKQRRFFWRLIAKRSAGMPLAYLTGHKEFWSLDLAVDHSTLIPRPETEHLVDAALAIMRQQPIGDLADLGTGTGAVALAIAYEQPAWNILATDISPQALSVAETNRKRLGIENVRFRLGDWFDALQDDRVDMIVSNPPYVASSHPCLAQGNTLFEPRVALDGGADGLDAIRRIVRCAAAYLRPGGRLLLEHGWDQARCVRDLMLTHALQPVATHRDYSGHERVTIAISPQKTPCKERVAGTDERRPTVAL